MGRHYEFCPQCRVRMVRVGVSGDVFGSPPHASLGFYRCSQCGGEWSFIWERNALSEGWPEWAVRELKLRGADA